MSQSISSDRDQNTLLVAKRTASEDPDTAASYTKNTKKIKTSHDDDSTKEADAQHPAQPPKPPPPAATIRNVPFPDKVRTRPTYTTFFFSNYEMSL